MNKEKLLRRFQIIKATDEGMMTRREAAAALGITERHVYRLLSQFRQGGKTLASLMDQRGKHSPPHKKGRAIRKRIKELKQEDKDYSNPHIVYRVKEEWSEKYGKDISLSPSTVRRILIKEDLYTPSRKRFKSAVRFEMDNMGELIQWDTTCSSNWFVLNKGRLVNLILQLDDATRKVLGACFSWTDDTYTNLRVARKTVERYGIPTAFYTDNDSMFNYLEKSSRHCDYQTPADQVDTEVQRALAELDSALLCHQPGRARAKGKIERHFQFFQNWFVTQHKGVQVPHDDQEALRFLNQLLEDRWVKFHNHRPHHGLGGETPCQKEERLREKGKVSFEPVPEDVNLDDVFCLKEERVLRKDNTFSYKGHIYHLPPQEKVTYKAQEKVDLRIHPQEKIRVFYKDQFVEQLPWEA